MPTFDLTRIEGIVNFQREQHEILSDQNTFAPLDEQILEQLWNVWEDDIIRKLPDDEYGNVPDEQYDRAKEIFFEVAHAIMRETHDEISQY